METDPSARGLRCPAGLVVSELVLSSTINAGTAMDLSVVRDGGALRLTVQDHGPALPGQLPSGFDPRGKVVCTVLDALPLRLSDRPIRSGLATAPQGSPVFTDSRGSTELPFCAGLTRQPA
jgi:hypothetical protein